MVLYSLVNKTTKNSSCFESSHHVSGSSLLGSVNLFLKDQIVNILGFMGQETKLRVICRYLNNHLNAVI